jgi:hypothetical protein
MNPPGCRSRQRIAEVLAVPTLEAYGSPDVVSRDIDQLIVQFGLRGDGLVCSVEQCPPVPGDQLDEQIVAIGEVAVDAGP